MKKKLLFVINTLGRAGAEMAMLELMRMLPQEEYEISLYVILGQGELVRELPEHVKVLNRTYRDTSVLSEHGRRHIRKTVIHSFFRNGRWIRKLCHLASVAYEMRKRGNLQLDKLLWRMLSDGGEYPKEEYDLAIAYLEGGATYFTADHVKAKRKAAFVHIDYENAGYTRRMDKDCYAKFDRIFAVSEEVRVSFLQAYPQWEYKTGVFHNIINRERISRLAEVPGGFADSFAGVRLLTVGRLTYQKAYDVAIDAMKRIKDAGYQVRWYVLGEGNQREILERQIKNLGLERDFKLVGAVENPYPYYRQCDIYVHATRFEGKSIAVQEAQVLGCAIVASDCNGNREQIEDGVDGILCGFSTEGISQSIMSLIDDPEKRGRLGTAAAGKGLDHAQEMKMLLDLL